MKTDTIVLSWRKDAYNRVMDLTEKVSEELTLNSGQNNVLNQIVEETLSMVQSILGGYVGELYFNVEGKCCELTIQIREDLMEELRDTFIRMASTRENEFKPTISQKIFGFFKERMNHKSELEEMGADADCEEDNSFVIRTKDGEVWEESERAILHRFADEIRVGSEKNHMVIKVKKDFA